MPTRIFRPLLALLVLAAAPLSAQTGLTAVQAAAMKRLSNVTISPDGRTVAYVVTVPNLEESSENSDIWLVPATGGGEPWRLTNAKESDESPAWSPDGRWIAFRSARAGAPQLYRIAVRGGEAEQLTTLKKPIQAFAWSPDGTSIAFVVERADTPEEEKRQQGKDDAVEVDRNFKAATLHVLDVQSRKVTDLKTGDYQIADLAWAPDSRRLAFVSIPTPRADDARYADIQIADLGSGAVRRLLDNPGPDTDPAWSPDGTMIAFRTRGAQAVSVTQNRLATIAADGGTLRMLGSGFLYEPGAPVWSPDGKTLMFWTLTRTSSELYSLPVAGGPVRQLSKLEGSLGLFGAGTPSISADGSVIAFARGTIETPDEVYTARLGGDWTMGALTRLNPDLATVPMGQSEIVRWKSKDGMEVEGILVYPVGYQPGRRYPTVAIIHGGPSGVWDRSFPANWYNSAQVYAGQGWLSFLPNPRGSSGYGEKFLAANYRDWGNGDYQDIQTGLDYLIQRGVADPARLAQTGWSYGGYMTAWTLTQTNRFKAVMVGAGLTNMYSMYSTNDLQMVLEEYFGAEPWDDEQAYRRASAMMFIKQARTPTLILHGQQDTRVPIGQAQELYMGLKKNDVPVELVFFPREPHGLREPRHMLDKIQREIAFFSRHVLGVDVKPEPVP